MWNAIVESCNSFAKSLGMVDGNFHSRRRDRFDGRVAALVCNSPKSAAAIGLLAVPAGAVEAPGAAGDYGAGTARRVGAGHRVADGPSIVDGNHMRRFPMPTPIETPIGMDRQVATLPATVGGIRGSRDGMSWISWEYRDVDPASQHQTRIPRCRLLRGSCSAGRRAF